MIDGFRLSNVGSLHSGVQGAVVWFSCFLVESSMTNPVNSVHEFGSSPTVKSEQWRSHWSADLACSVNCAMGSATMRQDG